MKTVWLVTSGEYSDYNIKAVCDSKESALKMIETIKRADPYSNGIHEPTEWVLNTSSLAKYSRFVIEFREPSGDIVNKYGGGYAMSTPEPMKRIFQKTYDDGSYKGQTHTTVLVYAEDMDKAVRIAIETRTKFLAEQNGL